MLTEGHMRLSEPEMQIIRLIRRDYRRAVLTLRVTGLLSDRNILTELSERRDRIIRSLIEEGMSIKQIRTILGVKANVIENAMAYEESDV